MPPTLNLPQVVTGMMAMRVGDEVRLRWTTPDKTTDKLGVKGAITAEICREVAAGTTAPGCGAVVRVGVSAGESEAEDVLPAWLAEGPVRLVEYRVRLLNAAGRTAGWSPGTYAAGGGAPAEVADFAGEGTAAGVELRWKPESGGAEMEVERTLLDPAPAAAKGERRGGLAGEEKEAVDVRLRAGEGEEDAGGMVDRTVELGHSYRYAAQRVVRTTAGGQAVELRSGLSQALTFAVRDVFAPRAPGGLVAAPALDADGRAAIDLSWDAVAEEDVKTRVAGYRVYRREVGGEAAGGEDAWRPAGAALVTAAAYRDAGVVAGRRYAYRVTAVSTAGNESAASGVVEETAPRVP